jgi:hypothetical protein
LYWLFLFCAASDQKVMKDRGIISKFHIILFSYTAANQRNAFNVLLPTYLDQEENLEEHGASFRHHSTPWACQCSPLVICMTAVNLNLSSGSRHANLTPVLSIKPFFICF